MTTAPLRISLLRHGETVLGSGFHGSTDAQLSAAGWQQMRDTVAQADLSWRRIVSSPLQRCAAFAQELAQTHQLPVRLEPRLAEMHFGAWEGLNAATLMERDAEAMSRFWQDPITNTPEGGEPLLDFQQRVLAAWQDLREHKNEHVLLITHGGVIRTLLCHVKQLPIQRLLHFDVQFAELITLTLHPGAPQLWTMDKEFL